MARFLAFKQFNSLRPADEGGESVLRKIGQGELVRVEIKRPRNIQHHRLFWALMTIVWENSDNERYPTVEDLAAAIKISAGHRTTIQMPKGIAYIPKSIAFHKMDQDEFNKFYERVCDVVAQYFLPGVTVEQLREEVSIMIGIRTEPEAQGSTAPRTPEPQASAEASAGADANGAADTPGTPAAPQDDYVLQHLVHLGRMSVNEARAIKETTEIAGETLDKPASGAEARAAGSVQGEGGPPSYYLDPFPPNIWAQYADWFVDKHTVSDVRKADTAWWNEHVWPDDDELKDKCRRIRKIHERRAAKEIDADQFTAQIREAVAS